MLSTSLLLASVLTTGGLAAVFSLVAIFRPMWGSWPEVPEKWRFPLTDLAALLVLLQMALCLLRIALGEQWEYAHAAGVSGATVALWGLGEWILYRAGWRDWHCRFALLVFILPAAAALTLVNTLSSAGTVLLVAMLPGSIEVLGWALPVLVLGIALTMAMHGACRALHARAAPAEEPPGRYRN